MTSVFGIQRLPLINVGHLCTNTMKTGLTTDKLYDSHTKAKIIVVLSYLDAEPSISICGIKSIST